MSNGRITAESVRRAQQELDDAAAEHGGHCEDDSVSDVCLQVCAPAGKVWVASDGAHIVCVTAYGPQQWLDDAVSDAVERIAQGTRDAMEDE